MKQARWKREIRQPVRSEDLRSAAPDIFLDEGQAAFDLTQDDHAPGWERHLSKPHHPEAPTSSIKVGSQSQTPFCGSLDIRTDAAECSSLRVHHAMLRFRCHQVAIAVGELMPHRARASSERQFGELQLP